jgi:hypothetical protein
MPALGRSEEKSMGRDRALELVKEVGLRLNELEKIIEDGRYDDSDFNIFSFF